MPQVFSNKDLNNPLSQTIYSKSRTYTNKDLNTNKKELHPPDILDDVDTQEISPPDILDDVNDETNSNISKVNENEPDTWMKGFINSVTSGDALDFGLRAAPEYLKGSTIDILTKSLPAMANLYMKSIPGPHTLDVAKNLLNTSTSNLKQIGERAIHPIENIKQGMADLDTAASNPEEFGRSMGQIFGQPAVTAGMLEGIPKGTFGSPIRIPSGINATGAVTETVGKGLQNFPVTDWMPRWTVPRNIRLLDRNLLSGGIGKGLEYVGSKMRGFNKPPLQGELVTEDLPNVVNGEYTIKGPKELPPSKTSFYGEQGLTEGEELTPKNYKVIRNEEVVKNKPKFRTNGDGTFTNLETGEVLDSKGQSIVEINKKPILNQVKPKTVSDLIQNLEQTGNINLDSSINKLKSLDYQLHRPIGKSPGLPGLNDSDFNMYSKLLDEIKPQLPIELQEEWNNIVKNAKTSTTNLKPGDKVKFREPSKATSKPTLVDKNSPFFTRNRRS